ncbi:hypothetical protein ON010_g7724 [Phytophthora cinnamomi]|nr:hypothetical protein ON010_g7724 [Phytophthora cinnamomi]
MQRPRLFTVVNDIVKYAEKLQTSFPNGTEEQIISLLNNSDIVIKDLPTAVCVCLGLNVPTDYLNLASEVVSVVNKVLTQAVEKGSSLLSVDTFMSFISSVGAGSSVESLSEDDTTTLEKLIAEGKTCGTQLQSIITKVTEAVADIKAADAASTVSAIRLALSDTSLFLTEIPTVTNNCIKNITSTSDAYTVRDKIRKALSVITDNLINSSNNNNGNALSRADYILKVADMGLDVIAMFDPTGIAKMLEEFIQPVCGPTSFIGEIDDGSLADALALVADGDAFADSYGTWTHAGDGAVNIAFESTDTEDVTVEIHSAGETIDSVKVKSGETVTWNSTVSVLQDKTMYFDRWRPGLLGLPGSGGGSLVMWVPRSSEGGHIDLVAKINGLGNTTAVSLQEDHHDDRTYAIAVFVVVRYNRPSTSLGVLLPQQQMAATAPHSTPQDSHPRAPGPALRAGSSPLYNTGSRAQPHRARPPVVEALAVRAGRQENCMTST